MDGRYLALRPVLLGEHGDKRAGRAEQHACHCPAEPPVSPAGSGEVEDEHREGHYPDRPGEDHERAHVVHLIVLVIPGAVRLSRP